MYIVVFVTCPDEDDARFISKLILERRLAACVNVIPGVTSLFWWGKKKSRIHESREVMLMAKTRKPLLRELTRLIKERHQYETPEVIAIPIIGGSKEYTKWINEETK